ncbi:MAG: diaminopimelate decarboxylase [Clostridia bacterium]|nr:diaminopimelate decarboxylase [Clostridia bacterium]
MICDNISINQKGHLTFNGYDTVDLAKKYGTPLYLMDEDKILQNVREYVQAMKKYLPAGSKPEFASKAFCCRQIYRLLKDEEIDVDVVSPGEIYTAFSAGFPMERVYFHGNNKTDADIEFAMERGVGCFIIDGEDELSAVNRIAEKYGKKQRIILRVSPGIDSHTHKKISTGAIDSKFGVAVETGQALEFAKMAVGMKNVELSGFHCHIGSQIFKSGPFIEACEIMIKFIAEVKAQTGFEAKALNLGGGFGVRYTESDPVISYIEKIAEVGNSINDICKKYSVSEPKIMMEPGRSIVANAGMTLYSVGTVKEIPNCKNYVSVDGGMTDNPRFALYESPYTVILASRANAVKDFKATVCGRCCESGDIIQENVSLPKPYRGEILAVLTTGAYNFSMASNYNRINRPPVVMLNKDRDYTAVKRETLEDLCRLDV